MAVILWLPKTLREAITAFTPQSYKSRKNVKFGDKRKAKHTFAELEISGAVCIALSVDKKILRSSKLIRRQDMPLFRAES